MAEAGKSTFSVHDGGRSDDEAASYKAQAVRFGGGGGDGGGDMDRGYVDARIEAAKAQNEVRFVQVLEKLSTIDDHITTQGDFLRGRLQSLEGKVDDASQAASDAKTAAGAIKWNILFAGLTVAALAYGGFALWNQAVEMTTGLFTSEQMGDQVQD